MSSQVWAVAEEGGYMYSDQLSDVLRTAVQPTVKFRQVCDADDATEKGLNSGADYRWDVYAKNKDRGGELEELKPMPKTSFKVFQQSLTVTEYGIGVPWTGKLDAFSAHDVEKVIKNNLADDCKLTLDGAAFNQFQRTGVTISPVSGTSTTAVAFEEGGCTITNDVAMGKAHVKAISDTMKERSVPSFEGDDYMCLSWPATLRPFKNELEAIKVYTETGFTQIRNGEIGRYESIRFMEQNHIAKGGAVDSRAAGDYNYFTPDPWNNAKSDWAFFFGFDTVMEAIVIPEEMRGEKPSDFGRSKAIAWYYLGGFGIVHGPNNDLAQTRIFKWESAA